MSEPQAEAASKDSLHTETAPRPFGDVTAKLAERKPMKLHFTDEQIRRGIESDPDEAEYEAGAAHPEAPKLRFFIEHGVIHDRATGKHVRACDCLAPHEDGIEAACVLLNSLTDRIATLEQELAKSREKFTMHTAQVHAWFSALVQEMGIAKEGETIDVPTACSKAMDWVAAQRGLEQERTARDGLRRQLAEAREECAKAVCVCCNAGYTPNERGEHWIDFNGREFAYAPRMCKAVAIRALSPPQSDKEEK